MSEERVPCNACGGRHNTAEEILACDGTPDRPMPAEIKRVLQVMQDSAQSRWDSPLVRPLLLGFIDAIESAHAAPDAGVGVRDRCQEILEGIIDRYAFTGDQKLRNDLYAAIRARQSEIMATRATPPRSAEGRPRIVCLCGSTRFMDYFHEAGWQYTLDGWIVLSVGVAKYVQTPDGGHAAEALGPGVAERLDELHLRKIDLADHVFVLNVNGYIGDSTRREIEYATAHGKSVGYLEARGK